MILERAQLTLDERMAEWAKLAAARRPLLATEPLTGSTLLVPMGWQQHDTGLVVTTMWDQQVDFTYSQSQRVWDFDAPPSTLGPTGIPLINFNQSDEWLETPDAAFWNDSAGASEPSYCWAFWVNIVAGVSAHVLFAKSPSAASNGSDWILFIDTDETFGIRIIDDSADAYIGSVTSALSDGLHHLAGTKHDDAVDSASILTYVDGVLDRSDDISGTYVNQEDGTQAVRIGANTAGTSPTGNSILGGPLGPVFRQVGTGAVWTPDAIRRDYQLGRAALGI